MLLLLLDLGEPLAALKADDLAHTHGYYEILAARPDAVALTPVAELRFHARMSTTSHASTIARDSDPAQAGSPAGARS